MLDDLGVAPVCTAALSVAREQQDFIAFAALCLAISYHYCTKHAALPRHAITGQ
jgi:hypothetical protein